MWQDSTQCSRSCGGGYKQQNRSCTNPVPTCEGLNCVGYRNRTVPCNEQDCPGIVNLVLCTKVCQKYQELISKVLCCAFGQVHTLCHCSIPMIK